MIEKPTEHVAAVELALHDALRRLRSVVDTAADGIITINDRGIIDSINPAAARMFGYAPEELIGRNVNVLMPSPHAEQHDQYLADYIRTGKAKIIGVGRELIALRRDGTTFPMRLAVSEMALSGRRHFTGIISDLSDRRQLERQVLESAASEQRRIGRDLHDGLCQQLGAMEFAVEMLRRKVANGGTVDPQQLQRIQQLLRDSGMQLRQIAHGMQPVHFRVGGLAEALRELARTTSERFDVACRARCAAGAAVSDEATADHLYRIAQEAAGNAIKHGKADAVRIHFWSPRRGGVAVAVVDNGVGLPAGDVLRGGRGMGLRIMKYRADAIAADFTVRPRRHGRQGAVVMCTVPPTALRAATTDRDGQ